MEHAGEAAIQDRMGVPTQPWGSAQVGRAIPEVAAKFIGRQRTAVIGARDDEGRPWATILVGPAGFLSSPTDTTVLAAALPGPLDPLAGAFETERELGMLLIEASTRRRMRINGSAVRRGDDLVIETDQVYANCPKYIQKRHPVDSPSSERPTRTSGTELTDGQRALIESSDTFFIATQADPYGADASHRGGNPAFVTASSPRRLTWPEYSGNRMYMTLGNLEVNPQAGLLFVDWARGSVLQLTGRARTDWDARRASDAPGGLYTVDFEIEGVVQIDAAIPLVWTFEEYSKFNPT